MSKILALIDGDGLVYHSSKETLQESIETLDEKINNIFIQTGATHYTIFISNSPYFRHKIEPSYKASRGKCTSTLKWLKTLKNYLVEQWGAFSTYRVEADDLCAYWANKELCIATDGKIEPREVFETTLEVIRASPFYRSHRDEFSFKTLNTVICSPDKDLLKGITGKHFNYSYKLEEKGTPKEILVKGSWVETTETEAFKNFWISMICGDRADGIKGIEGRGIVYAKELLKSDKFSEYPSIILNAYLEKYDYSQGVFEFQKNYRLLYLLKDDKDFIREAGEIPELPEIREVVTIPYDDTKTNDTF